MTRLIQILSILLVLPLLGLSQATQTLDTEEIAKNYIQNNYEKLGLTQADVSDYVISDHYVNSNNGWTQVYFVQAYNKIQVDLALLNINIKPDGTVPYYGNRFVKDLASKIESDALILSSSEAILSATADLGIESTQAPLALRQNDKLGRQFFTADYATDKITVQPKYVKIENGLYKLAQEVYIHPAGSSDTWFYHIDAIDGKVISRKNNTIYCKVENGMLHNHSSRCNHDHSRSYNSHAATFLKKQTAAAPATTSGDGAEYTVIELPAESPIHGPFVKVVDPSIEAASPYGWHDVDGADGAEYTITRGNNVWAYEDSGNNNASIGNEPDGGDELIFDFPYDPTAATFTNMEADVTEMFYMCNMLHDMTHLIGFDSASGAFQENTYGTGGDGNDPVRAEALDGSGDNNANFATPADGSSGRMQMFRWVFADLFRVLSPDVIAKGYTSGDAVWGMTPDILDIDITTEMVVVADSNPQFPEQGCGEIENDVAGKIALVYRGTCEFGRKALNAENAGAVAVIICNVPGVNGGDGESTLGLGAGEVGDMVTIPVTSLAFSDCERIRVEIEKGPVVGQLNVESEGPGEVSSGFDNGVIAHEYGHGISNRLIGGPSFAGCMGNDEQVGEGISDYFTLVMTAKEGDKGTDLRGIGNFVDGQSIAGRGIRRFPYSTDMSICPLTMDAILGTGDSTDGDPDNNGVHALGEVWAATLWDMYWAFTDLYGWTDDWTDDSAGNVRAMKLAIDGMKAVGCSAGYREMRDAIFAVDDGEHNCLLWEIFARRGMGFFADFGDSNERDDNIEDFEPRPTCITTLKIKRELVSLIQPGETVEVNVDVANHTLSTATNVIVTETLPVGMNVVDGSASVPFTQSGNAAIFELGDMATLAELSFSYTLSTDPNISSITKKINQVETPEEQNEWLRDINSVGFNFWDRTAFDAKSGTISWFVSEVDGDSDQRLVYPNLPVLGDRPALRFWGKASCTPIENGGFIEYSTDGVIWTDVRGMFIRGGYNNPITYANLAIPSLQGFSGYSDGFQDSYIDLTALQGENFDIRFRFATYDIDEEDILDNELDDGWYIDDLELMDIKTYELEAVISADNAEEVSDGLKEIIIDSDGIPDGTNTEDLLLEGVILEVAPNPASESVTLDIMSNRNLDAKLSLLSIDGRVLDSQTLNLYQNRNFVNLDVSEYSAGFYLIQLRSGDKLITHKLIIE